MTGKDEKDNPLNAPVERRDLLKCMIWAGTGVVWTMIGGIPVSFAMGDPADEKMKSAAGSGFSFIQLSDSHIGFSKPANPDAAGTLQEAIDKIKSAPVKPSFLLHTGDITHLSHPNQFDTADQLIGSTGLITHYVPGEHDVVDADGGKAYLDRYGKGTKGAGWYSFDDHGVHFVGLVNAVNLQAGGLGQLGAEQLAWLRDDLRALSASTPIVVFAHIPLWSVYPAWGWGTQDSAEALSYLKRFGSVTVLNGHIHQIMQKVEGNISFHTARATGFAQPAPGTAAGPGPMIVPAGKLRDYLGITTVNYVPGHSRLAVIDKALSQA
jgi:3',5'-cyclic AMP phosphodiesterase CpdA